MVDIYWFSFFFLLKIKTWRKNCSHNCSIMCIKCRRCVLVLVRQCRHAVFLSVTFSLVSFLGNQNVSTHQIAGGSAISQTLSLGCASPLRMGQTVGTVVFTSLHSSVWLEKEKRRPIVWNHQTHFCHCNTTKLTIPLNSCCQEVRD